jgi:hypothetical protein
LDSNSTLALLITREDFTLCLIAVKVPNPMSILANSICIGEMRVEYKILVGKPEGNRPFRRSSYRWGNNIKMNLK